MGRASRFRLGPAMAGVLMLLGSLTGAHAQTVIQQCGQKYQAAKAAGTLNGMNWTQFRSQCSAQLKGQPVPAAEPAVAPAATATNPLKPVAAPETAPAAAVVTTAPAPAVPAAPAAAAAKTPATGGRAAMLTRQKQCGAEWRAQKASLVAQTPGLTWPKYWSQCNTRLKAAGQ